MASVVRVPLSHVFDRDAADLTVVHQCVKYFSRPVLAAVHDNLNAQLKCLSRIHLVWNRRRKLTAVMFT